MKGDIDIRIVWALPGWPGKHVTRGDRFMHRSGAGGRKSRRHE